MIDHHKVLAIIPARGGSKTLPRKNIRIMAGQPLIAWSISESLKSRYIDSLVVSSEDAEIIEVAQEWGAKVPFIRPSELAQDQTPGIEPVIHAINSIGEYYDYVIVLQPTSPLRSVSDIDGCIYHCITKGAPACVSVTPVNESPYWMYQFTSNGQITPLLHSAKLIDRRQELPAVYVLNGAIYLARTEYLLKNRNFVTEETIGYIMPPARSMDIDTELDFRYCEFLKSQSL